MPDLLGLEPAPNNGTHGSLNDMLKVPRYHPTVPEEVTPPAPLSSYDGAVTHDLGCSCDDEVRVVSPQNESAVIRNILTCLSLPGRHGGDL